MPEAASIIEEFAPVPEVSTPTDVVEATAVVEDFPSPAIAPEMTPPEAVTGVTPAESSPPGDITSDDVEVTEVVENMPESNAHLVVEETTSPKEITTCPPVKGQTQHFFFSCCKSNHTLLHFLRWGCLPITILHAVKETTPFGIFPLTGPK